MPGCCIQASVTIMKKPDIHEPRKTMKAASQWTRWPKRFSPKRKSPRNDDSRKNAKTPSIPGAPPRAPARVVRKPRQIGAKLKLHRDSSDDAKEEIDGEYFGPEARRAVVALVPFPQSERLEDHDERREPHRELGEDIVVGYGEGEMQPMNGERTRSE